MSTSPDINSSQRQATSVESLESGELRPVVLTPEPPPAKADSERNLDRVLVAGIAWTGLAKWSGQVLSWVSTIIVARLLSPSDYGIMGMAMVYLGFVQLVSEFGLGSAIIQQRDLDESQIARIGGLSVLTGVGLFLLMGGVAPAVGTFFGEPAVGAVTRVLAVTFVTAGLQVVPSGLLTRDLAFRKLATIDAVESVTQTCVTLALAVLGAGYWALVLGGITGKATATALLLVARWHPLAWPRQMQSLRRALLFGWHVVVSRITWYVYSNADFAIIGRVLGTAALGAYTIGWTLASVPVDKIAAVLGRVSAPVFSATQHDRPALARYLFRLIEGLSLVVLPASIGLALVAPDLVHLALGPKWTAAVVPLQLLSVHVLIRCVNTLGGQALLTVGGSRQSARLGLTQVAVMPVLFYIAARSLGINGVAATWVIAHPLVSVPMLFGPVLKRLDARFIDLARAIWPAVAATIVMATAVAAVGFWLEGSAAGWRLAASILAGVLSYSGFLWIFQRQRIADYRRFIRDLRART